MSSKYASTQNVSNLVEIIKKIPEMGVPKKVTVQFLETIGYRSKNDRSIIPVLKFVGIVESNGVPSDNWTSLRDRKNGPKVLGELIKKSYEDLFNLYPDANEQNTETLKNFFSSQTTVGEASIRNILGTFQNLCRIADFEKPSQRAANSPEVEVFEAKNPNIKSNIYPVSKGKTEVHFNIQIHVPGDQSSEVYESLFKSLGKYVLGIKEGAE